MLEVRVKIPHPQSKRVVTDKLLVNAGPPTATGS